MVSQDTQIEQRNRIQRSKIVTTTYKNSDYDKGGDLKSQDTCCLDNWIAICKRLKLDIFLKPYIGVSVKRIINLNK